MALLFSPVNKPKRFEIKKGYYGEKKDRQKWLEERVRKIKRESGELTDEEYNAEESIRGTFAEGTTRLKRRQEQEAAAESENQKPYSFLEDDEQNVQFSKKDRRYALPLLLLFIALIVFYFLLH